MVDGPYLTPVDCDYRAGSVGRTPRPIAPMLPKKQKGLSESINWVRSVRGVTEDGFVGFGFGGPGTDISLWAALILASHSGRGPDWVRDGRRRKTKPWTGCRDQMVGITWNVRRTEG